MWEPRVSGAQQGCGSSIPHQPAVRTCGAGPEPRSPCPQGPVFPGIPWALRWGFLEILFLGPRLGGCRGPIPWEATACGRDIHQGMGPPGGLQAGGGHGYPNHGEVGDPAQATAAAPHWRVMDVPVDVLTARGWGWCADGRAHCSRPAPRCPGVNKGLSSRLTLSCLFLWGWEQSGSPWSDASTVCGRNESLELPVEQPRELLSSCTVLPSMSHSSQPRRAPATGTDSPPLLRAGPGAGISPCRLRVLRSTPHESHPCRHRSPGVRG